jgi:outer membrane receptor protein involved in Fe transport
MHVFWSRCRCGESRTGAVLRLRQSAAVVALILPLFCVPTVARSQERGGITGAVRDAVTSAPISNVVVRVEGLERSALTDAAGRYLLLRVPPGPHVLVIERLGYAPLRIPVQVQAAGTLVRDIVMAEQALKLPGVVVTADPRARARGELGTASVIDREAIQHQTASSLAGLLELVPGIAAAPPGLDGVQQIALRSVPTSSTLALQSGGSSIGQLGSFGTLIVLDGVPLSNNANLQSLGPRGELGFASSSGGGIDLRTLPASTIERVEVIRGIASARFGDLTQGAIVVDTRAGVVPPVLSGKRDPRTGEGSVIAGRELPWFGSVITTNFDVASTRTEPGLAADEAYRFTSQLSARTPIGRLGDAADAPPRLLMDTRLDVYQLIDDRPENPNTRPGRWQYTRDRGFRVSERARLRFSEDAQLELTASLAANRQRAAAEAPRTLPGIPFTDRMEEGRSFGNFIGGNYIAELQVDGAPRLFYSRLEGDRRASAFGASHRLRAGLELRREWNAGAGYDFDMSRPPQVTFNGIRGYDRPRRFDALQPMVTSAFYIDDQVHAELPAGAAVGLQVGGRINLLHETGHWFGGVRDAVLQPRLNAELQTPLQWVRRRGGWGRTSKAPSLGMLFPAPEYYDLVNVNWFAPDPAERIAVITTTIMDAANPDLGFARSETAEAGAEIVAGNAFISAVAFRTRIRGGFAFRHTPSSLLRDRYALTDTVRGSGRPPTILEPPIGADTVPLLLLRPDNLIDQRSEGVELTVALPEFAAIRTRLHVQAAWITSRTTSSGMYFGGSGTFTSFQSRTIEQRLPFWEDITDTGRQVIATYRVIHHQPALGLVITGSVQHNVADVTRAVAAMDTLSFAGYLTRTGEVVRVPRPERAAPEYVDLRGPPRAVSGSRTHRPSDWMMSLQVSKSLPLGGRFSFWAFNALDRLGRPAERENELPRTYADRRFGLEVTIPFGELMSW